LSSGARSRRTAQAQAFVDAWGWNDHANAGYDEILANDQGRLQPRLIELIKGLHSVVGAGSLLAYLISISLRITEIHRVLKPNGSFYLHCDPTVKSLPILTPFSRPIATPLGGDGRAYPRSA
jgi:hypothetical protein